MLVKDAAHILYRAFEHLNDSCFTDFDNAQNLLNELAEAVKDNDYFSGLYYYYLAVYNNQSYQYEAAYDAVNEALVFLSKSGSESEIIQTKLLSTGICLNRNDVEEAEAILNIIEPALQRIDDPHIFLHFFCRKGYTYLKKGKDKNAWTAFEQSLKIADEMEEIDKQTVYLKSLCLSGMGWLLNERNASVEAVKLLEKTVQLCEDHELYTRINWRYLYLANATRQIGDFESAKNNYVKILDEETKDKSDYVRAMASVNLGQLYQQEGQFNTALDFYKKAEQYYRTTGGDRLYQNLSILYRSIAKLFKAVSRVRGELEYLKKSLVEAEKCEDDRQLAAAHEALCEAYQQQSKFKKALLHSNAHKNHLRKIFEKEREEKITELQIKYEAERKEKEAELLRLQAEQLQMKALRAQMNPHFIFNCLNSIQQLIIKSENELAGDFLVKFAKLIRKSLEYSDLSFITLEDEIVFLKSYLELEKLRFKDQLNYTFTIDEEVEEDLMRIPPMVLQPYVENAIVHGIRTRERGQIDVDFNIKDDERLICTIRDNGIGRNAAASRKVAYQKLGHKSFGTKITEQRLQLLKNSLGESCHIQINDLVKNGEAIGTEVILDIPIIEV